MSTVGDAPTNHPALRRTPNDARHPSRPGPRPALSALGRPLERPGARDRREVGRAGRQGFRRRRAGAEQERLPGHPHRGEGRARRQGDRRGRRQRGRRGRVEHQAHDPVGGDDGPVAPVQRPRRLHRALPARERPGVRAPRQVSRGGRVGRLLPGREGRPQPPGARLGGGGEVARAGRQGPDDPGPGGRAGRARGRPPIAGEDPAQSDDQGRRGRFGRPARSGIPASTPRAVTRPSSSARGTTRPEGTSTSAPTATSEARSSG